MSKQEQRIVAYRAAIERLTDADAAFIFNAYKAYDLCRAGVMDLDTCVKYVGGYAPLGYQVTNARRAHAHEDPAQRGPLVVSVLALGFEEFVLDITFDIDSITWRARWAKEEI